jgi:hypothetical protein
MISASRHPAALLVVGLLLLPRSAGATSCADVERGGATGAPACPVAPVHAVRLRTTLQPRAVPRHAPVGPLKTDAGVALVPTTWSPLHPVGSISGEFRDVRSTVESDMEMRDCYASLCGPQSITLRVGSFDKGTPSTFSPMIGGLGAVAGAIALTLKPGPRPEPAPGPSLDGWADGPKGLKPSGPPYAFLPLISIANREGGLRALLNW